MDKPTTIDYYDLSAVPIETIYKELAQYIVKNITGPWKEARLTAEIDSKDSGVTFGRYTTASSSKDASFETDYIAYLLFDELRVRLKKKNKKAWVKAVFQLWPTGKFDLKFEY